MGDSLTEIVNRAIITSQDTFSPIAVLFTVLSPIPAAFVITWIYRKTQKNTNFSIAFIHSLLLFCSLTSVLCLIIGTNLARAFGLIGAMSVIRFRNALKSPIDAVFVFWALVVGMGCGSGFYFASYLLTGVAAGLMLFVHYFGYGKSQYHESLLKISVAEKEEEQALCEVEKVLNLFGGRCRKVNVLYDGKEQSKLHVYSLRMKRRWNHSSLVDKIESLPGIKHVSYLITQSFASHSTT